AALLAHLRGEPVERFLPPRVRERVQVPRDETHAGRADRLELLLDPRHRALAIAMGDGDVHAVPGELLGGREAEAARAAEDQCPVRLLELDGHSALVGWGRKSR